jgi:glutathione S-transferase
MARRRRLIHTIFLFLAPLIVAWFGLSAVSAALLVLLLLVWRWAITMSGLIAPEKTPGLVLETISISHYVEKVRWCMDRLGLDYTERQHGGTLGAYFTGRTVPELRVRTGAVQSVIGNSPEILRFLWGNYSADLGDKAAFLEPTAERIELEGRLDRYGRHLQVWIYYHILDDQALTLRLWGAQDPNTPAWQRLALRVSFPLLRALIRRTFRISVSHYEKTLHRIDELLGDVDTMLADGRRSILGGNATNYTDITFAALSGPWLRPPEYGSGKADACVITLDESPPAMQVDIGRWREDHPRAASFIESLYADEREAKN